MGNYDDFDLDLKKTTDIDGKNVEARSTITVTSVVISKAAGCTDGRECAMPTKDRPAASCHKNMAGAIQRRC